MNILHALNPYSPHFEAIPDNYLSWKKFKKLSIAHQVITILATAIVTALSLTYYTASCFRTLVGRLRKIERVNNGNPSTTSRLPTSEAGNAAAFANSSEGISSAAASPSIPKLIEPSASDAIVKGGGNAGVEDGVEDKVEIEDRFWEALFVNKSLNRAFEMAMKIKDITHLERATFIAYSYIEHENDVSNRMTEGEKALLINRIAKQLKKTLNLFRTGGSCSFRTGGFRSIGLSNGSTLKVYDTEDDGSCGFHAILGTNASGIYKCQDVLAERQRFCDWLREMHHLNQLPNEIKNIIRDYALHYDIVPGYYFKKNVQARYEAYAEGLDLLSNAEKDARLEEFVNDVFVIEAYISNMLLQGTYLLQEELIILGNLFGKRVILFQPDWGHNGGFPTCMDPSFSQEGFALGENDICVWYDGNHYERAELRPANRERIKQLPFPVPKQI